MLLQARLQDTLQEIPALMPRVPSDSSEPNASRCPGTLAPGRNAVVEWTAPHAVRKMQGGRP